MGKEARFWSKTIRSMGQSMFSLSSLSYMSPKLVAEGIHERFCTELEKAGNELLQQTATPESFLSLIKTFQKLESANFPSPHIDEIVSGYLDSIEPGNEKFLVFEEELPEEWFRGKTLGELIKEDSERIFTLPKGLSRELDKL